MVVIENIILFISFFWCFLNNFFIQYKSDWVKMIIINFFFEYMMVNYVFYNEKLMEFYFYNFMLWKYFI